jgi:Piwi domain
MRVDSQPVIQFGNFNAPTEAMHRDCENLYTRVTRDKRGAPELLMFIIKGKSAIAYETIKGFADVTRGVPSQCIAGPNVEKKGRDLAYHANLLLKVNTKLGGTTVSLTQPIPQPNFPTVLPPQKPLFFSFGR